MKTSLKKTFTILATLSSLSLGACLDVNLGRSARDRALDEHNGSPLSPCADLDQEACLATAGCRAEYGAAEPGPDGSLPMLAEYLGCVTDDGTTPPEPTGCQSDADCAAGERCVAPEIMMNADAPCTVDGAEGDAANGVTAPCALPVGVCLVIEEPPVVEDPCALLDEATCVATAGCEALYAEPINVCGNDNPTCGGGSDDGVQSDAYPRDIQFLGCQTAVIVADPCALLDEATCVATNGCEPLYAEAIGECGDGYCTPNGGSDNGAPANDAPVTQIVQFIGCQAIGTIVEPAGCVSDLDCQAGETCLLPEPLPADDGVAPASAQLGFCVAVGTTELGNAGQPE